MPDPPIERGLSDGEPGVVVDAPAGGVVEALPVGAVDPGAEVQATETNSIAVTRDAERASRMDTRSRYLGFVFGGLRKCGALPDRGV
jgi:hypothetical protein